MYITKKKDQSIFIFGTFQKAQYIYIKQKNIFLTAISDIVGGIKEHNVI